MIKETKKKRRRRYYLHSRLKKRYKVKARRRLVLIPFSEFQDIPSPYIDYCHELVAKNYSIQSEIS